MDGEDLCIPALVPSQRPFFSLTPFFFFIIYSGLQAWTESGSAWFQEHVCVSAHKRQIPSSFLQNPSTSKANEGENLYADSFSASVVETMFCVNDSSVLVSRSGLQSWRHLIYVEQVAIRRSCKCMFVFAVRPRPLGGLRTASPDVCISDSDKLLAFFFSLSFSPLTSELPHILGHFS